ncbi:MAG: DUF11 domain-containing protein [Pseudoxanthomonas sp.]|nr:DUF11 domain-containing protein [Pseudoxanthomonas sp.]
MRLGKQLSKMKSRIAQRTASFTLLLFATMLPLTPAQAQVQRNFSNPSFELPLLTASNPATGCYKLVDSGLVPGWNTTHPVSTGSGDCLVPATTTGRLIELWRTNFNGVAARDALNFAELNAEVSSRIFQNVCLINGEPINWRFSHRGRGSATIRDVMDFNVGASVPVVRVGTTSTGAFNAPVLSQGSASAPASGGNGWVDYRGTFNYGGITGTTSQGFESISTGSGGNSIGNFLDDIRIELAPFVEFTQSSSSTPEGLSQNLPTLRVNGTVFTAFNVTVQITGGTATLGVDFTTPGNSPTLVVNVPAGSYDGSSAGSLFALPITVVQDSAVEGNETIILQVQPSSTATPQYLLNSSSTCGGPAQTIWVYTIVDDDSSISLTKNAAAPTAVAGQPTQFNVVYTLVVNNPTALAANYSLTDTPGLDSDVSILSASVTLNGGASSALAGSGPWILQPQWRVLAAGATDTYAVTVRININRGGSVGNDVCASPSAPGSGLHNSASAVLQGTPNATFTGSACSNTPTPVWVTLRKRLSARAIATDQVQIRLLSAGNPVATATTTGSASPSLASTALVVLPAGNTMQFDEAVKANGTGPDQAPTNYGTGLVCSNATAGSATILPGGPGTALATRRQWTEFTPVTGDDLDCEITNTPLTADLSISKSNSTGTVTAGGTTSYAIVVRNAGAAAASNAVVRDPATPGLSCTSNPTCSAAGGASCPASLAIASLQGTGLVIPSLPSGGAVTFNLTCTVTATGLP